MTALSLPKPVAQDERTVTLDRAAWELLVRLAEDAADVAAVKASRAREAEIGASEFRRLAYTATEARRIALDDVSPVTIWRERAGLSQRALARRAGVSASYLAEIEAGKKPGSVAAFKAISVVLDVPLDVLAA